MLSRMSARVTSMRRFSAMALEIIENGVRSCALQHN